MATVSNSGGGSSMGNAQQGTRGLSASDWTRIQRLRGARNNGYSGSDAVLTTNEDIAPATFPQLGYNRSLLIRKTVELIAFVVRHQTGQITLRHKQETLCFHLRELQLVHQLPTQ